LLSFFPKAPIENLFTHGDGIFFLPDTVDEVIYEIPTLNY